jgi:hypothetical protein
MENPADSKTAEVRRLDLQTKAANESLDNLWKDLMEMDTSELSAMGRHLRRLLLLTIAVAQGRGETIERFADIIFEQRMEVESEGTSEQKTV